MLRTPETHTDLTPCHRAPRPSPSVRASARRRTPAVMGWRCRSGERPRSPARSRRWRGASWRCAPPVFGPTEPRFPFRRNFGRTNLPIAPAMRADTRCGGYGGPVKPTWVSLSPTEVGFTRLRHLIQDRNRQQPISIAERRSRRGQLPSNSFTNSDEPCGGRRLEGWRHGTDSRPSMETGASKSAVAKFDT